MTKASDPLKSQDFLTSQNGDSDAAFLSESAATIRQLQKRVVSDVIEIGRLLGDCKSRLGHGHWLPWLKREFTWSERTARNFISAYEFARSRSANVADLGIEVSSLYLLAAPSTPQAARAEVLCRAENGESVPHAEVKRIVDQARTHPVPAVAHRRITAEDAIKGFGLEVFGKLTPGERSRVVNAGPRFPQALAEAEIRRHWELPYLHLHDALELLEKLAKLPAKKFVTAIPVGEIPATTTRIGEAIKSLTELDRKLRDTKDLMTSSSGNAAPLRRRPEKNVNSFAFAKKSQFTD